MNPVTFFLVVLYVCGALLAAVTVAWWLGVIIFILGFFGTAYYEGASKCSF